MQEQSNPLALALSDLQKAPTLSIHGKQYSTVATRVEIFRRHFPEASIISDIVTDDEMRVVMRTRIITHGETLAVGHAEEVRGAGKINSTSALENAETSSIGRALASLGISGSEFASYNEVSSAISQQNTQQTRVQLNVSAQQPDPQSEVRQRLESLGLSLIQTDTSFVVTGKTYGLQSDLKSMGFHWSPQSKQWHKPLTQEMAA